TGIALGNGGVYLGQAPNLYFLQDTNGDDVADTREVLLAGFGLEDRHELLNGFTSCPDGWLYLTHGVFTHSKVKDPNHPENPAIDVPDCFVVRIYPGSRYPLVWFGGVLLGNIHPSAINHDYLASHGSSFKASAREDFMASSDGWFRPVGTRPGPDGAGWIIAW